MKLNFKFKTKNTDGTLLYFGSNDESDFMKVSLVDGYVRLEIEVTDRRGRTEPLVFDSFLSHADGNEHLVKILIENDNQNACKVVEMTISSSGKNTDWNMDRLYTQESLKSNGILYLGGDNSQNDSQHHSTSLDGSMAQVTVNDIVLHLVDDARHVGVLNSLAN